MQHDTLCFIDDSPVNVAAAREIGIDAQLLDRGDRIVELSGDPSR